MILPNSVSLVLCLIFKARLLSQLQVGRNLQAQVARRGSAHRLFRLNELDIVIEASMILQERGDVGLVMSFLQGTKGIKKESELRQQHSVILVYEHSMDCQSILIG